MTMNTSDARPSTPQPAPLSAQRQAFGVVLFGAATFAAAALGGSATGAAVQQWYPTLNKPSWNPPSWVFGPVWTALYISMAIAAFLVWRRASIHAGGESAPLFPRAARLAFILTAVQLILNGFWSVIFFGMRQPGWAFAEIIALWLAIAACTAAYWRWSRVAAALMLPYLAWVTFASVLNFAIWQLNP
jgi:translocator protein